MAQGLLRLLNHDCRHGGGERLAEGVDSMYSEELFVWYISAAAAQEESHPLQRTIS